MSNVRFLMEVDGEIADQVVDSLAGETGAHVHAASKRNLDGSPETVIQIIDLALSAVNIAVPLVLSWASQDRVRKFRLGDTEIDNPTPEQVEVLWQGYLARRNDG